MPNSVMGLFYIPLLFTRPLVDDHVTVQPLNFRHYVAVTFSYDRLLTALHPEAF